MSHNRKPALKRQCNDTASLYCHETPLAGPFDFQPKAHRIPDNQIIDMIHWTTLIESCHSFGLVPPKLSTDPVLESGTSVTCATREPNIDGMSQALNLLILLNFVTKAMSNPDSV